MKIYKFIGFIALLGGRPFLATTGWMCVPIRNRKKKISFRPTKVFGMLSPDAIWLWLTKMCMVAV